MFPTLCSFLPLIFLAKAEIQSVKVFGCVTCRGSPVNNLRIDVWEKDFFDPDDHLNFAFTDSRGCFSLTASDDELLDIDPYILVNHQCSKEDLKLCSYEFRQDIRSENISRNYGIPYNFTVELSELQYQTIIACTDKETPGCTEPTTVPPTVITVTSAPTATSKRPCRSVGK